MSQIARNYIKKYAGQRFPAQELWIRSDDRFWAFEVINDSNISFTNGQYKDNDIIFITILEKINNTESYLDNWVNTKLSQGFECFAIEL